MRMYKIFLLAVLTIGSASAQSHRLPKLHSKEHGKQHSAQKNKSTSAESKVEEKSSVDDLQYYFYPFAKFSYIITPEAEHPCVAVTYSISNDNILTTKSEIWNGSSLMTSSESLDKLVIDTDRQAVISTQRIVKNPMGVQRSSDKQTLFLLPKDNNTVSWTETVDGETSKYSVKFVYVAFTHEDKKLYRKAVKMEKTTQLDKKSINKEWSYWVKGLSRLATYGYWGDPKKVSCIDKSVNISLNEPITEISKAEYDRMRE